MSLSFLFSWMGGGLCVASFWLVLGYFPEWLFFFLTCYNFVVLWWSFLGFVVVPREESTSCTRKFLPFS